jgi:hypothetical protein
MTEEAIERGIAAIADLLQPPARRPARVRGSGGRANVPG